MTATNNAAPVSSPKNPAAKNPAIGIRVLQMMAGAEQGGAELYFARLCAALQRAGIIQLAIIRPQPERMTSLDAVGIPIIPAPFGGWFDFTTRRIVKRAIASFKPQIVMSYMTRATRYVPRGNFVHIARLGGYYDLRHYRHCDHLVGNTPDLVEYFLRGGWLRERAHFIPNFVDTRRVAAADRARYATPKDAPLVLALGRFHHNKAFDVLLEAVARLPGIFLWLAGDGPGRASLEAETQRLELLDRVRFLGWQKDPGPFFAAANVLAVPSRHEPLGNVILEAWAQGLPVVAAESQGPRFLIQDGKNGVLVPVEDAEALAMALQRVLGDRPLSARLIEGGSSALAAHFSQPAVVAQYMSLFSRVLD